MTGLNVSLLLFIAGSSGCNNRMGWGPNISLEDFLDNYLYISFKQGGIILGGYRVVDEDRE
jgi:hypothetical protein